MFEDSPLIQVIASLIILLLMGYFAYNIYLIEFEKMLKSSSDVKKEVNIIDGIYDYNTYTEMQFNTIDETKETYLDINPSINQEGGAEYSYNFWLYTDTTTLTDKDKDIVLFFKGEKNLFSSSQNYNCSTINAASKKNVTVLIKNPLVKLRGDGKAMVVEFNNIYNPDSYQQGTKYVNCENIDSGSWDNKNRNLLGIYDLNFNKKWFMVTIVMKEVADANNILMKNRASCKIYINGINVLDKKAETLYNGRAQSATFKNNKAPFYMNPSFEKSSSNSTLTVNSDMQRYKKGSDLQENVLKLADLKYYNYALSDTKILELLSNGFGKKAAKKNIKDNAVNFHQVSSSEMQLQEVKEI
jgi:hypothetical protein